MRGAKVRDCTTALSSNAPEATELPQSTPFVLVSIVNRPIRPLADVAGRGR